MKRCLTCRTGSPDNQWVCPECGYRPLLLNGVLAFSPAMAGGNPGFSAGYFSQLAPLEAGHFWFESRNRLVIWALRHYFPNARKFLEIGCGTGFVLSSIRRALPDWSLAASEVFIEGLSFARSRLPEVDFFQMDARDLPFESEFDVIGAFDVLEHIEEDDRVLTEMARAVVLGGGVVLTVPQHPWLWSDVDEYSFHKRRYTRTELADKLDRAGLQILRATSFVSLLLPAMVISRCKAGSAEQLDPYAELRISPILNKVLQSVLSVERGLISAGISLPAGGSLLIVAKKGR